MTRPTSRSTRAARLRPVAATLAPATIVSGAASSTTGAAASAARTTPAVPAPAIDCAGRGVHAAVLAAVGLDAHHARAGAGVPGDHGDPVEVAEKALTEGTADGPRRHADDACAFAPLAAVVAQPVPAQMVPVDEPVVDAGDDVVGPSR